MVRKWLTEPPAPVAPIALVALVAGLMVLAACQASVDGLHADRADLSILCGSSSSRLLPECKDFRHSR